MPKIPIYEKQIAPQAPNVAAPRFSAPPASAFPTSSAEAAGRLGSAITDAGSVLAKHAIEKAKEEEEKSLFDAVYKYQEEVRTKLWDPEKGHMATRKLDKAKGIYGDVRKELDTLYETTMSSAPMSAAMRESLHEKLKTINAGTFDSVVRFEREQGDAAFDVRWQASQQQFIDAAAAYRSPAEFKTGVKSALDLFNMGLTRKGITDPKVQVAMRNELVGKMAKSYINDLEPNKALAALDALKEVDGAFPVAVYKELRERAENGAFLAMVMDAKRGGLSRDKALLLARGGESAGMTRTEGDPGGVTQREEIVRKLYAETDFDTWTRVHRDVMTGNATGDMVEREYAAGNLSRSDAESFYKMIAGGTTPAMKAVLGRVDIIADDPQFFPNNNKGKRNKAIYEYQVRQKAMTMTPDEVWKYANDALKKVPVEIGTFWDSKAPAAIADYEAAALKGQVSLAQIEAAAKDVGEAAWKNAGRVLREAGREDSPEARYLYLKGK